MLYSQWLLVALVQSGCESQKTVFDLSARQMEIVRTGVKASQLLSSQK